MTHKRHGASSRIRSVGALEGASISHPAIGYPLPGPIRTDRCKSSVQPAQQFRVLALTHRDAERRVVENSEVASAGPDRAEQR